MDHEPSAYGDAIASAYDALYGDVDPGTIAVLQGLAGDGPALELGIGTGRLALPLMQRGVRMHGIEASLSMIAALRAKPGGQDVEIVQGDFSHVVLPREFPLIFIAFNTIFCPLSPEDQERCFANVASMLRLGGVFVVEAFVPDMTRFERGQRLATFRIEAEAAWLEAAVHDADHQRVDSHLIRLSAAGVQLHPIRIRYAWPGELDRMAERAGLRLRERWAGWDERPFTPESGAHVSIYER